MEHVPESPGLRVRGTEVRRRPRLAERLRPALRRTRRPEAPAHRGSLRQPARQALVRRRVVSGSDAHSRNGVGDRVRGGVHVSEAAALFRVNRTANQDAAAPSPQDGGRMMTLARQLYPINRSLTGEGVRETLGILGERLPLDVVEVSSGTSVYDWTVPPEWNVREAWFADSAGRRIVDLRWSTLHVV